MKRLLMKLEYLGTNYRGWQVQNNEVTLEETLEKALEKIVGHKVELFVSGRTDVGVHALEQYAHFDTCSNVDLHKILTGTNCFLPKDVAICEMKEVRADFDARKDCVGKSYLYKFYVRKIRCPQKDETYCQLYSLPDIDKMKQAAKLFVGEHDFSPFMAKGSHVLETTRKIFAISIWQNDEDLFVEICGNGFLYKMVRTLVGTLIAVGKGKASLKQVEAILEKKDRSLCGKTMPANGLHLKNVFYSLEDLRICLQNQTGI